MSRLALVLHGGRGRMGRAISEAAEPSDRAVVCAVIGRGDTFPDAAPARAVVIDFSTPAALPRAIAWATEHGVPLVCGTTGLANEHRASLARAADCIPVLYARNTSLGVAVLEALVAQAAAALPASWAAELVELHHDQKADAPSGTALALLDAVRGARPEVQAVHGRSGRPGPRDESEAGMHAVRGGTVAGEHTVYFFGPDERIELTHRASNRSIFARGALAAAHWLSNQPAGLYGMRDVLGGLR